MRQAAAAANGEPNTVNNHRQQLMPPAEPLASSNTTCTPNVVIERGSGLWHAWTALLTAAVLYNWLIVVARTTFASHSFGSWLLWLLLDWPCDLLYLADMLVRSRTSFLEDGLAVVEPARLRQAYVHSSQFVLDVLSALPTELLYVVPALRYNPIVRLNRVLCVTTCILILIHWNACAYFALSTAIGLHSDRWVYGVGNTQSLINLTQDTLTHRYLYSVYWSVLTLTTIGETPVPANDVELCFVVLDFLAGLLIFATIVGNVGSMITNSNSSRAELQQELDSAKHYMTLGRVDKALQTRVIRWFEYLAGNRPLVQAEGALSSLPRNLQSEIAANIHYDTLKKASIFDGCEPGLLTELVLKLKLQVFSPGDFVCRKGDIGREMYIVKGGRLCVLAADGSTSTATLQQGDVFGELSLLNVVGNRRTASVLSLGYSHVFALSKSDLWTALDNYPDAKQALLDKSQQLIEKDNLSTPNDSTPKETDGEMIELATKLSALLQQQLNSNRALEQRIDKIERQLDTYRGMIEVLRRSERPATVGGSPGSRLKRPLQPRLATPYATGCNDDPSLTCQQFILYDSHSTFTLLDDSPSLLQPTPSSGNTAFYSVCSED